MATVLPVGINAGAGGRLPSALLDAGTASVPVRRKRRRRRDGPAPYTGEDERLPASRYPFSKSACGPLDNSGYDPTGLPHRLVMPWGKSVVVRLRDPELFHPRKLRPYVTVGAGRIDISDGATSNIIITGKEVGWSRVVAVDEDGKGRGTLDVFVMEPVRRSVGVSLAYNVNGSGEKINASARLEHEVGGMFKAANQILYPQTGLYFHDAHPFRSFTDRQLPLGFGISEGFRETDINALSSLLDWSVDINVVHVHKLKLPFLNSTNTVAAATTTVQGKGLIIISDKANLVDGATLAHEICHTLNDPKWNEFTGYGTTGAERNHSSEPDDLMSPTSHVGGKLTGTRIRWEESLVLNPAGIWPGDGGLAGLIGLMGWL